jgi:[ribosomal protein S18]-alanine N-acetyltransferase
MSSGPSPAAKLDPAGVEVRAACASDLDEILALAGSLQDAPRWSRAHYQQILAIEETLPSDSQRQRFALVARDLRSGQILGFIFASLVPPEGELESIAVAPQAQRKRIGRQLLSSLVTRLRTLGMTELHLEVRASNQSAVAFYLAANFNQTGVRPRYYADPEEDAVLMTLRIV